MLAGKDWKDFQSCFCSLQIILFIFFLITADQKKVWYEYKIIIIIIAAKNGL
jgi:hypothetical protein